MRAPLSCPSAAWCSGLDLKVRDEVVGDNGENLPRAVGSVVLGGDRVERISSLELGDDFLVSSATRVRLDLF